MNLWRKEKSLIYALHPERIPAAGARFSYSLGLGGISVFAALVTGLSGVLLSFYYVPTPDGAYASVVLIEDVAAFGTVLRGIHYWGAQLMVVAVTLHLARVVFTGGYRPPRELNWLVGLGLLVLTLLWDFTGYVLRWDEGAYWALLIGTNLVREIPVWGEGLYRILVGDVQVGANALLRFYGWHAFGLTLVAGLGIVYHLWRLRQDGGISRPVPRAGEAAEYVSRDELFFRELLAALLLGAALLLVSTFIPAPLGKGADPVSGVVADVRAPWIFLWVQTLLRDLPPLWAGIVAPLACLFALVAIPFLDRRGPGRGVWCARERWRPQALLAVLAFILILLTFLEVVR